MLNITDSLVSLGGVRRGSKTIFKLFDDYQLIFEWDDEAEKSSHIYIISKRFSAVMGVVFGGADKNLAKSYLSRKLIRDAEGALGTALRTFTLNEGVWGFCYNDMFVRLDDFVSGVTGCSTISELYEKIYITDKGAFFIWVEGAWVFLYLAFESGLNTPEHIHVQIARDDIFSRKRAWSLKKPIDDHLIELFAFYYRLPGVDDNS